MTTGTISFRIKLLDFATAEGHPTALLLSDVTKLLIYVHRCADRILSNEIGYGVVTSSISYFNESFHFVTTGVDVVLEWLFNVFSWI